MKSKIFNLKISKNIKPFKKEINVDSDKSLSIRAFLIGSISQGISSAKNVLESDDVMSTINCLKKLNVKIKKISPKKFLAELLKDKKTINNEITLILIQKIGKAFIKKKYSYNRLIKLFKEITT